MRLSKQKAFIAVHSVTIEKMRAMYAARTAWTIVATNAARQYVQVTGAVLYSHITKIQRLLYVGFVTRRSTEN